jgi:hypothetical protein
VSCEDPQEQEVSFITKKVMWKTFFTTFHQIEKSPMLSLFI